MRAGHLYRKRRFNLVLRLSRLDEGQDCIHTDLANASAWQARRILYLRKCGIDEVSRPTTRASPFKWKDYRLDGAERYNRVMTLDTSEFIRRFLMHVLPSSFHRIRRVFNDFKSL